VRFRWVKGHGTDPMNAWVDELAVLASQSGRGQSGERKG
jgi:ribonuclease HI